MLETFQNNINGVLTSEFIPPLKLYFNTIYSKIQSSFRILFGLALDKYKQHKSDYQEGIIRDFTDAMIYSQQDSLKNEKESAPYLTDNNLAVSVNQLFLGKRFC